MDERRVARAAARHAQRMHETMREDIDRLRLDAGLSVRALAASAGVDQGFLHRILDGTERPSLDTYARLAVPLGADPVAHLYPNTGPMIRDRHQARMLELLLRERHPRWQSFTEVAVRHPARGVIDALLHEPREGVVLATELESGLRRIEQQVRWASEKAASLESWEGWVHVGAPRVSRLLVLRRTRATRATVATFATQLRVAYPAHPDDALESLTGTAPWPGAAMIWVVIDGERVRLAGGR